MGAYYRTYKDVQREEFHNQEDARLQLLEKVKTPIKYDIYPTIVTSKTDEEIESELYNHRFDYDNSRLHTGSYIYNGYNKDYKYKRLYTKIFDLNKSLWEVPPMELATAYLDLFEEFELFEVCNDYVYDFHADPDDRGAKARLAARKCGINMISGLQFANKTGFFRALNEYTAGAGVYKDKSDFKRYAEDVQIEVNKGKESFESDEYFAQQTRDKLPCMYTMLNLFCGMYRDIFYYRNRKEVEQYYSPQMIRATGFDEYKYQTNGGKNFETGWMVVGLALIWFLLTYSNPTVTMITTVPMTIIGIINIILGWKSL